MDENEIVEFIGTLDEGLDEVEEALTYLWEDDESFEEEPSEDEEMNFDDINADEALLQQEALEEALDEAEQNQDLYMAAFMPEIEEDVADPVVDDDYDGEIVTIDENAPDEPVTLDDIPDEIIAEMFEDDDAELEKEILSMNSWYNWPDSRWKE